MNSASYTRKKILLIICFFIICYFVWVRIPPPWEIIHSCDPPLQDKWYSPRTRLTVSSAIEKSKRPVAPQRLKKKKKATGYELCESHQAVLEEMIIDS